MTAASQATDWRVLREFAGVDLEQSFVLSWEIEYGALLVDIDVHLLEAHPFYEKPRPAEKVCIRPAVIEFPLLDKILVDGSAAAEPAELVKRLGLGAIHGFQRLANGHYEIKGRFGRVLIEADRPVLRLKNP